MKIVELGFVLSIAAASRLSECRTLANPASGAVLRKIGMTLEGTQRRHFVKWGQPDDLVQYGLLREEFTS